MHIQSPETGINGTTKKGTTKKNNMGIIWAVTGLVLIYLPNAKKR